METRREETPAGLQYQVIRDKVSSMTKLTDIDPATRKQLAGRAKTSDRMLQHIQVGRRQPSAMMAIRIERAAKKLGLDIRRESLCSACRGCDLAKRARG